MQGSVAVVYPVRPQEEQPLWLQLLWKPGFIPAVTPELSVCRFWRLWGGSTDLLSSGQECPCCPGPSRPLPIQGGGWILGSVLAPSAPNLHCWIHALGCAAASLWSCSRSPSELLPATQPPLWSRRPSPSELLRVPPCMLQPSRKLGALSWARRCLLVFQVARGHPRPPGVLL